MWAERVKIAESKAGCSAGTRRLDPSSFLILASFIIFLKFFFLSLCYCSAEYAVAFKQVQHQDNFLDHAEPGPSSHTPIHTPKIIL